MTLPTSSPDGNRNPTQMVFDSSSKLPLGLTALNLTNANALHVAIVDATGTQITSFGSSSITSLLGITTKGQALMANSLPVVVASDQSAIAVTLQDGNGTKINSTSQALNVSIQNASLAVTGTFWQTTQPVSIASMPSTPVTGTFWQSTQPVSLASLPSLAAGTADIGRTIQKDNVGSATSMTISLNSLASSSTGVGRQSTLITSNTARSALIKVKIKTGTTPTVNTPIYVYLIRGDGTDNDDSAGSSDAGLTVVNAPLLGVINNNSASTGQTFVEVFDTKSLGSLGATWGIAIVNNTAVALDASAGGAVTYQLIT